MNKPRVYYGWMMVLVAALAMVATLPGRTHGLGMITERLLADSSLNLDRRLFGRINFWATLCGGLFCIGAGRLVDRWGVRLMLSLVLAALAATVVGMCRAPGLALLVIGITLTRGFGQSALSVVSLSIVGKWFTGRRLSRAMGVYAVLMASGFIASAVVARRYVNADWRSVWAVMGYALAVLTPLAWLTTRDSPQDVSNHGGASAGESHEIQSERPADANLHRAMRTGAFWAFGLSTSMYGLVASGVSLFNESILVEQGLPKQAYYDALAIGTAVGLLSQFSAGWLAARLSIARLTGTAMLLLAAALAALTQVATYAHLVAYVVANAFAGGIITVVFFSVWGRCYGQTHLGEIQGAAQMMTVLASAVGPLVLAEGRTATGSYSPMLFVLAAVTAALGIATWFVRLPGADAQSSCAAERGKLLLEEIR